MELRDCPLVEPMAAALAARNFVVAKPSELAPTCSSSVGPHLLHRVDRGRSGRGRRGGEAPHTDRARAGREDTVYVHASADLDLAAARIAWAKYFDAGQTCVAPDYVLADRSARDDLVERLVRETTAFFGSELRQNPHLARIVSYHHVQRLLDGEGSAAGVVATGGHASEPDRFVEPTITVDPDPDAPIMHEEIFGPVLPVLAVDGPDQAVDFVTSRPKPLALYVFGRSRRDVRAVVDGTSSGAVGINQTIMQFVPPRLPFEGVGDRTGREYCGAPFGGSTAWMGVGLYGRRGACWVGSRTG